MPIQMYLSFIIGKLRNAQIWYPNFKSRKCLHRKTVSNNSFYYSFLGLFPEKGLEMNIKVPFGEKKAVACNVDT